MTESLRVGDILVIFSRPILMTKTSNLMLRSHRIELDNGFFCDYFYKHSFLPFLYFPSSSQLRLLLTSNRECRVYHLKEKHEE